MVDVEFIRDRLLKEVLNDSYPDETRSVLLFQAGQAIELSGGENADALRQYLLAVKLEDSFSLPVLATSSMLVGAASYERLNRFMALAMERTSGRVQALARLLMAEHIDAAPVEDRDRIGLLEAVCESERERNLALALLEWEHLRAGDTAARADVIARWRDHTTNSRMAAQLGLELARLRIEGADPEAALGLLPAVLEGGRTAFPTLPEVTRLAIAAGSVVDAALFVLDEACLLADAQATEPELLAGRFVLATPASAHEAACQLLFTAWQLLGREAGTRKRPEVVERLDRLVDAVPAPAFLAAGMDGIVLEHLLGSGRTDALDRYLEMVSSGQSPVDAAWSLWNATRAALSRGDFVAVGDKLARIRDLGFDSRVLDALLALGGASTGTTGTDPATDPVRAMMDADGAWATSDDVAALARSIAAWEVMGPDVADLAYAAARLGSDSFLRTRALQGWSQGTGEVTTLALLDDVRTHVFERSDPGQIGELLARSADRGRAVRAYVQLAALTRSRADEAGGGQGRQVASLVGEMLGEGHDPGTALQIACFASEDPELTMQLSGPPGAVLNHALLGAAHARDRMPEASRWLASALDGSRQVGSFEGALALELLSGTGAGDLPAEAVEKLVDPASGLDPATRLLLSLSLGRPVEILDAVTELSSELEPGPARSGVKVVKALQILLSGGDAEAAMDVLLEALEDDPSSVEALFVFAFAAPAAGRWEDLGMALSRLAQEGQDDDAHVLAWRKQRMLIALLVERDLDVAAQEAEAVLGARGGDPLALVVRMAVAGSRKDIAGFTRELSRLSLWFGNPSSKGMLAHHLIQLSSLSADAASTAVDVPRPDVVNLSGWVATAALNGPVDLTDAGVDAAFTEIRALRSVPHRVAALVELAELVEAAGQPGRALDLFASALDDDPLDPLAVEGAMRLARDLERVDIQARACEARAALTADRATGVKLLLRAAESYAKSPGTTEQAARCYQKAAELDPTDPRSFAGLAKAMELRGDLTGVIDLIETRVASTMEVDEIETLQLKLADLKRKVKDFDGALIALDDLLLVQPGKVTALKMKLDLLLQMQSYGPALVVADRLLEHLRDRPSRIAVIQKCVSVALTRIKDLEAGLRYCLLLVKEGEADQDLVNKTMRLALRLERWSEAAELQDSLARGAPSTRERVSMLLKKAEIMLRYAKDVAAAEQVYRQILDVDPTSWDALARWNASRGNEGLSLAEVEPVLDRVRSQLVEDPSRVDAVAFLVKAYRMLKVPAAARHFDAVSKLLTGPAEEGQGPPARPSLVTMLPEMPSGVLDDEEKRSLLGEQGPAAIVVGVLSNLCEGGALEVLRDRGLVPVAPESGPMEPTLPVARQLMAWGTVLGVQGLTLTSADDIEEGARLVDGTTLLLDSTLGHTAPQHVQFRAGLMLGALGARVPVAAMMTTGALVELVKAGLMAADRDPSSLAPGQGTVELADLLRRSCTAGCISRMASYAELASSCSAASLEEGVRALEVGLMKAGLLVSGSLWGLLVFRQPALADREDCGADVIKEFIEADPALGAGLGFLLSSEFGRLRNKVGLEY